MIIIRQTKKIFLTGLLGVVLCGAFKLLGEAVSQPPQLRKANQDICKRALNTTPLDVNLEDLKREFLFEKIILRSLDETTFRQDLRDGTKRFVYLDQSGGAFKEKETLKALKARIHTSVRRKLSFVLSTAEGQDADNIARTLKDGGTPSPPRVLNYSLVKDKNFPRIIENSLSLVKRTILVIHPDQFIEGLAQINGDVYEELIIHTDALYFLDLNDLKNEDNKNVLLTFLRKSQAVFFAVKISNWVSSVLDRVDAENRDRREIQIRNNSMFFNSVFSASKPHRHSFKEVRAAVQEAGIKNMDEYREAVAEGVLPHDFPLKPNSSFRKQWVSRDDFFGINPEVHSFHEVRQRVIDEGLQTWVEYKKAIESGLLPPSFPLKLHKAFPREYKGSDDFFGRTFEKVTAKVRELGISSLKEYQDAKKQGLLPSRFPSRPDLKFFEWAEW